MGNQFKASPAAQSATWRRFMTGTIHSPEALPAGLNSTEPGTLESVTRLFPMRINPYYLSLITSADDPLGRQVIPTIDELDDMGVPDDPLAEEAQSPVSQVIHRYPHRVAFLVSNQCAVYCRFCMRKRRVGEAGQVTRKQIATALDYIRDRTEINEVVLTGGDPLMLDDDRLADIINALRQMAHIRIIRIHTRIPVVLPQRITPALTEALSRFHPLYINLHVNHPAELTTEVITACRRLAGAGIPLGSQTVMLRGINDDAATLTTLMENLLFIRIRPYYVHQLDRVPGTRHFRVPLEKSITLINGLRGTLSGLAVPHLMVDLPDGGGKVAFTADPVINKKDTCWQIRNWQGRLYDYPV